MKHAPQPRRNARMKRPRKPSEEPWNDPYQPLELFVTPEIKQRFRLTCKTTVEYLNELAEMKIGVKPT